MWNSQSNYIRDVFALLQDPKPVNELIFGLFYCSDIPIPKMGPCLHVLDVLRKSLLQEEPRHGRALDETSITPRSATELHDAGVQLKKSESTSLDAITFRRGVLRLPFIFVDDATESKFLNLLAFERFHVGAGNEVMIMYNLRPAVH